LLELKRRRIRPTDPRDFDETICHLRHCRAADRAAAFYLILLPVAGLLEGVPVVIDTSVLSAWSSAVIAALVVALFDRVASLIELPSRPIAAAVVGWVLAFALLREVLALPDLPGWFAAIGLLGAIPGFVCSWAVVKMEGMPKMSRAD
jgi:hypothetical protein